ncbi:MAG: hypothetical protein AB1489_10360 [Acidobacteriota bacterium]
MLIKCLTLLIAIIAIIVCVDQAEAQEFRFSAQEDQLIGRRDGELIISHQSIEFRTSKDEYNRAWKYTDIRLIELPTPKKISIWTYQDNEWMLGKDRHFTYHLAEPQIDRVVIDFLRNHIVRPFVISFATTDEQETPVIEIAVKHKHRLGGCQGLIKIYKDRISYITSQANHSRDWYWNEIQSIGRTSEWRFDLVTYERDLGGSSRTYNFQLKESLPNGVYDSMWSHIYRPTTLIKPEKEVYTNP